MLEQTTLEGPRALMEPSQDMAVGAVQVWVLAGARAQLLLVVLAARALICLPTGAPSMATLGGLVVVAAALDLPLALVALAVVDAETVRPA